MATKRQGTRTKVDLSKPVIKKTGEILIGSEAAAFELMERALRKEFEGSNVHLSLQNWPRLRVSLRGEGYDSTITADVAEALVDVQKRLNRAFALVVLNHASAVHLKEEQRDALKFKAKVEKGSSLITLDLSSAVQYIAQSMVGKMTGTELLIAALGVATIIAATSVTKQYLKDRAENKHVSEETKRTIAMSQEETKRQKILADALSPRAALRHVKQDFDEARDEILSSVGDADTLKINGIEVDRHSAKEMARRPRASSQEVQLNGTYFVSEASFKQEFSTRVWLRRKEDGKEFAAEFQDESLDQMQLDILRDAAFARTPVYLSINGAQLRGDVTKATIISVAQQPIIT
ncbi:hypothetical protein WHX56_15210 [Achromobacter veterisilvae]|uniref:Uncharacterized protein n=1 Tax=Achromobacter veterisilvae TaxID=2069367 RepID=A0ABZ2S712_9BURK